MLVQTTPVDQGQAKGSWGTTPIKGGAVVGNSSKQMVFLERGRGPGPVPLAPIEAWVRRHGSMWRSGVQSHAAAAKERSPFVGAKVARRSKSGSFGEALGKALARHDAQEANRAGRKAHANSIRRSAEDAAVTEVAVMVALGIKHHGFKGHWVLRRAMKRLEPKLHKILKAHIAKIEGGP